ncbi:MAG: Unknown protein [uncultured Campylobacterales bacterium]|uniref:Uncharacterized protein n=1 Tax=uncultured Campylobacterales bacterium TaxID=352960 RepID=A0A6S6SU66_9BACT|nr:MAG: Unknown protein [uncultured Campylobacterales bacterium]
MNFLEVDLNVFMILEIEALERDKNFAISD